MPAIVSPRSPRWAGPQESDIGPASPARVTPVPPRRDRQAFGVALLQLQLSSSSRYQLGNPIGRPRDVPCAIRTRSPREGVEEVSILRHLALEARDVPGAFALPLHEAMARSCPPNRRWLPELCRERTSPPTGRAALLRSSTSPCTSSSDRDYAPWPSFDAELGALPRPDAQCASSVRDA